MDSFYSAIIDRKTDIEKQDHGVPKHWGWELRWLFPFLELMDCVIMQTFKFAFPEAGRVCILDPLSEAKNGENDKMHG